MKLCVACKAHHPRSEFAPAHPEFPTRDGLNYNCKASTVDSPRWMRLPNGRIQVRKFKRGDRVRKLSGSEWKGRIVGEYSTSLTPEGYAVESDTEKGSVQIYPVGELELVGEDAEADVSALVEALSSLLESLCIHKPEDILGRAKGTWSVEAVEAARAALAAHRKGGDV